MRTSDIIIMILGIVSLKLAFDLRSDRREVDQIKQGVEQIKLEIQG